MDWLNKLLNREEWYFKINESLFKKYLDKIKKIDNLYDIKETDNKKISELKAKKIMEYNKKNKSIDFFILWNRYKFLKSYFPIFNTEIYTYVWKDIQDNYHDTSKFKWYFNINKIIQEIDIIGAQKNNINNSIKQFSWKVNIYPFNVNNCKNQFWEFWSYYITYIDWMWCNSDWEKRILYTPWKIIDLEIFLIWEFNKFVDSIWHKNTDWNEWLKYIKDLLNKRYKQNIWNILLEFWNDKIWIEEETKNYIRKYNYFYKLNQLNNYYIRDRDRLWYILKENWEINNFLYPDKNNFIKEYWENKHYFNWIFNKKWNDYYNISPYYYRDDFNILNSLRTIWYS